MAGLSIRGVTKTYPNGVPVLKGIDLEIADGQFLILVGGSGCGKSTLLNMIAGLESVTAGEIRIGERVVNELAPKDRDIAMVFQSYALYPSMTVRENIAFGLTLRKVPKAEQEATITRVAKMLQMEHLLDRKPGQLSGGQRQRVAMGRALARNPALYLFDEPLSNLDAKLRVEMRSEIKLMHQRLKTTIVYVTHDQIEAMTLGDRIAVMKDGLIQQFGSPQEIYDNPANLFVAGFIGSPAMNFIQGKLTAAENGLAFARTQGERSAVLPLPAANRALAGRDVILGIRPEQITHASVDAAASGHAVECMVDLIEPTGPDTLVFTHFNGAKITARVHPRAQPVPGQTIRLMFDTSKAVLFDPGTEARLS
jgi:multiple sugar transport system ATP-binding protein